MTYTGKIVRMNKIFKEDGKSFVIAMDHGIGGTTKGIEDFEEVVKKVTEGGADAVLVNFGQARRIAPYTSRRIGMLLTIPNDAKYVPMAVKLGADAVKTTYFGSVPLSENLIDKFMEVAMVCEDWGMPFMAEIVPQDSNGKLIYEVEKIKQAARIGVELGGDIIKTSYAGSPMEYKEVVRSCKAPIVVLGGEKMDSQVDLLKVVKNAMDAGAAGGTIGRNIWQQKDPKKITRAIISIVHEGATVEQAAKLLN